MACAIALTGCGGDAPGPEGPAGSSGAPGTLPAPAGTPGTSVTGMPTSPPPPPVVDPAAPEAPAPADPAAVAGDPTTPAPDTGAAPPVDGAASPDPAAAPVAAAPAPDAAPDPAAASRTITEYMAALSSGAFGRAQGLWAAAPTDGPVLDAARGNAFAVDVGPASSDPAGRPVATVPVQVRALAPDGTSRSITAVYTLQRGTGATWRIVAASVREGSP